MAFWIGLYPKPFFQILEQPVNHTMAMARPDYPQPGAMVNASAKPAEAPPQIPVILDDRGAIPAQSLKPTKAAPKGNN
jgi:hypothetical protein